MVFFNVNAQRKSDFIFKDFFPEKTNISGIVKQIKQLQIQNIQQKVLQIKIPDLFWVNVLKHECNHFFVQMSNLQNQKFLTAHLKKDKT